MLISISGPHGGGKTTLLHALKAAYPEKILIYPEDKLEFPKVQEPYYERLRAKLLRYYFESLDQQQFEKQHPNSLIFCNRCIYDSIAYTKAYHALGWITQAQVAALDEITERVFDERPQQVIILNPSLDTLLAHLKKRWATGIKKWNEENLCYLEAAHKEYELFYEKTPLNRKSHFILYLTDGSLDEKISRIADWLGRGNNPLRAGNGSLADEPPKGLKTTCIFPL